MTFSELRSEELGEQLRLYMASPEGGIRPEIHALWSFWVHSIRDSDGKIDVPSSDGYDVANLFWDLHEPSRLVPQFDEDIIKSLEYHVLLIPIRSDYAANHVAQHCTRHSRESGNPESLASGNMAASLIIGISFGAWSFDSPRPEDCGKWFEDQLNRLNESFNLATEPPLEPDWQERIAHINQMRLLLPNLHDVGHICSLSLAQSDRDCEQFVLECLDWLYERYKVSYEPDGESSAFFELDAYIHIAAARAFRIKQNQGLSEEVTDCLTEVERTEKRIEAESGLSFPYYESIAPCHSTQTVVTLAYVEISRQSAVNGRYVDALHYLAKAVKYYDSAVISNNDLINDLDNLRLIVDDRFDMDLPLRRKLEENLTGLQIPMDEAVSVFRSIKENASDDIDWSQVADDCTALQIAYFVTGREEDITDERGYIVAWVEFWAAAQAWTSVQLSPSEYWKRREDDEKHAAETYLKNYFFSSNWSYLPERARESLISADLTWNSLGRVRRESILNELLRATEEMCERFILQPMANDSPDILSLEAKMAERRRSLGVRDYINICELPSLPSLLSEHSLADDEIRFLTEDLPASMRRLLAGARNPAEHETGISMPPALVDSAYRLFLGIGQPGILPQLARIGRKLQSHRPQNPP